MGNQQSGAGGGGKDKGEQKEKKKYEPPVPTRVGKIMLSDRSNISLFLSR